MKTNLKRIAGQWRIQFKHGTQTFTLDFSGTKQDCKWHKVKLNECFKSAFGETLSKESADVVSSETRAEVCDCDDRKPHLDSGDGMIYCLNCTKDIKQT